jgi:hypothetical protein
MPDLKSFDYAVIRVVPRVEREEFVNAGVILFCPTCPYLGARIALDRERLTALDSTVDLAEVERVLALIPRICAGDRTAGPIAELPLSGRFHWLVAPRSTVVQPSPVHTGLTDAPEAELEHLVDAMVRAPSPHERA